MMHIFGKSFRGNSEFDPRPSIRSSEDAAITGHQAADEFLERLLVPSPRGIGKALEFGLLPPQAEPPEPADDWIELLGQWRIGPLEITANWLI